MGSDKAVALLSGGIDSPVAINLMQNKVEIIAMHFHQLPLTDETEVEKVKLLADKLGLKQLYLVPFADVLKQLVDKCNHRDYFILSKILMFRTANFLANQIDAKFLITGENLAQVSSQTLSNLSVITLNVNKLILRPLLIFDKNDIINVAKKIGTYEISKGPEICCLLGPKYPSTRSEPDKIELELSKIGVEEIIKQSLNKSEVVNF
ncbi:hypothetical protein HN385_06460 [archaeon]|mgnify:FL=1|nr:hypothetical protein [archaeon]MBT3450762.1 hypothetical protein [archaeon]MBT6869525.1 hypothetical protein [archaeon]MBT7193690.1 hypothetical protein [archaeon]MBT7380381.1 hypothetical protein [archaeon]